LIVDSNDANVPIELHRITAPLDLVPLRDGYGNDLAPEDPFPPRLPSTLPAPGKLHAHLALGEKIGSGRSSIVHNVDILPTQALQGHLPPLVLKVGRLKRRAEIGREAWFYDEMECMQGVILPRCYGWFEAELAEGQTFGSWYTSGRRSSKTEDSNPDWRFEDSSRLLEMSHSRNFVSVLLLERLGVLSGWITMICDTRTYSLLRKDRHRSQAYLPRSLVAPTHTALLILSSARSLIPQTVSWRGGRNHI